MNPSEPLTDIDPSGSSENPSPSGGRSLGFALSVIIVWFLMASIIPTVFFQPPPMVPATADEETFSAERAKSHLELLVGDGIPHPAGSAQNDVVRERIMNLLRQFGYEPQIQETSNTRWRQEDEEEFPLENIMARLPGKLPGQALMLVSHYDSVPQGPGASDDGVGTACVLEIARMLKNSGPFEHDIIFLITDGEELGLLGAQKFAELHPWAKEVECVINLEARGTSGPSMMFETSEDSRWLIPTFAPTARRPMTSSLFYEIYKTLPNDTDFTIFKDAGMQGFNFAFIGKVKNYHTPDDSVQNVDMNTFQHHGENMLNLAKVLADTDFQSQPKGQVVYFDLLGRTVIWWPAFMSLILASGAFVMIVSGSLLGKVPNGESTPSLAMRMVVVMAHLAAAVLILALLFGGCVLLEKGMSFDGLFDNPWPDFPWPIQVAFFSSALTVLAAIIWILHRFASNKDSWAAIWILWSALAILMSCTVNGASYLMIVPSLFAGLAGLGGVFGFRTIPVAAAVGAIVCGFLWLPSEVLFFDALGFRLNIALIIRVVIISSTMLPVIVCCNRQAVARLTAIMGAISLVAILASHWVVR